MFEKFNMRVLGLMLDVCRRPSVSAGEMVPDAADTELMQNVISRPA